MESPYTKREYWKAYAELYWPDLNGNEELKVFCAHWAKNLPKPEGAPLRVLALGFGFGGVELPLLHHLQKTGVSLEVVAIDNAVEPLAFAHHLLEPGIGSLPKDCGELLPHFDHFPSFPLDQGGRKRQTFFSTEKPGSSVRKQIGGDEFMFVWDDLEWDPPSDSMNPTWGEVSMPLSPRPSQWASRLRITLGDDCRFHLVIASFSLFHIGWWRRVLHDALGMLVPGGGFLHGKVQGDEALFEGRPGKRTTRNHSATAIFRDGLFADSRVMEIESAPRGASASNPFVIEEYLARLESFGLEPISSRRAPNEADYKISNSISVDVYRDLLKTQGFSTFRRISKGLNKRDGSDAYERLCREVLAKSSGLPDQLEIDFLWSAYRVQPDKLVRCPLHPRFTQPDDKSGRTLAEAYIIEYATNGAASIHQEPDDQDLSALARTLGAKLVQQNLLHPASVAVQFGFIPPGSNRPLFYFLPAFSKSEHSFQERQVCELALYLSVNKILRQVTNQPAFSNTQNLLDVALKHFRKACVFTYRVGGEKLDLTYRAHRDYEEIRFLVPDPRLELSGRLKELAKEWGRLVRRDSKETNTELFKRFVFDLGDFDTTKAAQALDGIVALLWDAQEIERQVTGLKSAIDGIDAFRVTPGSLRTTTADALKQTVTPASVFRSICLQLLTDTKTVVFYPATYEMGGETTGRDVVIVSYSEALSDRIIESELHKFNQVFERIRLARVKELGEISVKELISHELLPKTQAVRAAIPREAEKALLRVDQLLLSLRLFDRDKDAFKPAAAVETMPLSEIVDDSISYANAKLLSRSGVKRSLSDGLSTIEDKRLKDILKEALQTWSTVSLTPANLLLTIKDLTPPTNFRALLGPVLRSILTQAIYHECVFRLIQGRSLRGDWEQLFSVTNCGSKVEYVIVNRSARAFTPSNTKEYRFVIPAIERQTGATWQKVEIKWECTSGMTGTYESRVSIIEPLAPA